ncbi:MAG: SGNH/GDSL hydrolase family protein [Deltaproteobacteria bacterium HGW-Deltaproteobacteria-14]|jgi:acyl-CoA thioesterase-1|nr:MAG: SGNH/GDSL hydrolase family protein [Deltaproteobacteria bacterium HGW-Deltaproteobacteria-14]
MKRLVLKMLPVSLVLATLLAPRTTRWPAEGAVIDDPTLPSVLLIGDSISKGYAPIARAHLAAEANVHWPLENCHATSDGLARLDAWLAGRRWDVIHFNWGLHDLKYVHDGALAAPGVGRRATPLEAYQRNLERLVTRLEATGAQLVWASTTPVPPGCNGRVHGDAAVYNAAALRVMRRHGVLVNDLHAFALPRLRDLQRPRDVHFTTTGSAALAAQVARAVRTALDGPREAAACPGPGRDDEQPQPAAAPWPAAADG